MARDYLRGDIRKAAEWSELLCSYLTTGWYDWCVAARLRETRTHCWSVTSAYYAQYILVSALLLLDYDLYVKQRRKLLWIAHQHARVSMFLKGDQLVKPGRRTPLAQQEVEVIATEFRRFIAVKLGSNQATAGAELRKIGELLEVTRAARESHTYHVLVVSHQALNRVKVCDDEVFQPNQLVQDINELCLETLPYINGFVTKILAATIEGFDEPLRSFFCKHLLEEMRQFQNLIVLENVSPAPKELEVRLTELVEWSSANVFQPCLREYSFFQRHLNQFDAKRNSYARLRRNREELLRVCHDITNGEASLGLFQDD